MDCYTAYMADHLTPEQRSWNMGQIKGKNTKPELIVRSLLHRAGYRFTVNGSKNKKLPGKPDIVLPKYKTAVFVHGCFWHRHLGAKRVIMRGAHNDQPEVVHGCKGATTPKTRTEWWQAKFDRNVANDKKHTRQLRKKHHCIANEQSGVGSSARSTIPSDDGFAQDHCLSEPAYCGAVGLRPEAAGRRRPRRG